ncbi:MAG: dienelactone hydrolase family protein [Acetobacteraceae bacterium]
MSIFLRTLRRARVHFPWFMTAVLLVMAFPTSAEERVQFRNPERNLTIAAYLSRPSGDGPAPAVVMLHGCSGLVAGGRPAPLYTAWRDLFLQEGFAVLMVDSASSRGFGQTCTAGEARKRMWAERPSDAYAALAYLQAQPFIDATRISLAGWSQGGGVVLLAIGRRSSGRPDPPPVHDFARAVAFYPGACSETLQSRPFVDAPAKSWTTEIPLLVLLGAADNWTLAAPCEAFLSGAQDRGAPVEFHSYTGASHAFDAPATPTRVVEAYREGTWAPVIGTSEEARADAYDRVRAFLRAMRAPNSVRNQSRSDAR